MDCLSNLNKEQMEAVLYNSGPLIIFAGAGTGKTRVIINKIVYLIENGMNPSSILAITFTNKAANEMKERIHSMIGALADDIWISTFHSMCARILRTYASYIGFDDNFTIYDADESKETIKKVISGLDLKCSDADIRFYRSEISRLKNEGISADDYKEKNIDFTLSQIYSEYEEHLFMNNCMDFDDLLLYTKDLLMSNFDLQMKLQDTFKYILVDEYQDTNHVQFELIKLLLNVDENVCVVGDDDQNIYSFRGADIRNILDFNKNFSSVKSIKLLENYRSTQTILNAANAVISNNKNRVNKKLRTSNPKGNKIKIINGYNTKEEADFVISDILKSNFNYSDIAILYRANRQSRALEESCLKYGVPYQIISGISFYQRKEIKDLLSYLKFIDNPKDTVSFERMIQTPKKGIGTLSIQKIEEYAIANSINLYQALKEADKILIPKNARSKIKVFLDRLDPIINGLYCSGVLTKTYMTSSSVISKINISNAIMDIFNEFDYNSELEKVSDTTDEYESRKENVDELVAKVIEMEKGKGFLTLSEFLENVSLVSEKKEDEHNRISLMTLHSSKGLEFKKVYMIGMNDFTFPKNLRDDSLEEERRLCYVGMTRAMEELTLSYSDTTVMKGYIEKAIPSIFLREIPEEYIETVPASLKRYR